MPPLEDQWELLSRHRHHNPVAWLARNRLVTADEMRGHVAGVAEELPRAQGHSEVLILCQDRYAAAVGALAAWSRGHAIALPPNFQPQTVAALSQGGNPILHDGGWQQGVDVAARLADSPSLQRAAPDAFSFRGDRPIAVLYTSGSTGDRRRCVKSARQLLGEAEVLGKSLGLGRGDRVLASVPSQHIYGLLVGVLVPLTHGAAIVSGSPLLAEEVTGRVRESGATVFVSVPAHLRALYFMNAGELAGLRLIVSSSAPLDPRIAARIAELSTGSEYPIRVVELLGSTETGGIALREGGDEAWRPLPGVTVSTDPDGRLLVNTPFLDASADRPYASADRIALMGDGPFKHLGRVDAVVKIAGRRITASEIEERLHAIAGVVDASALAFPADGGRGHEIWALVVAPTLDVEAIRAQLLAWFDPALLPRRIRLLAAIPREPNGKVPLERWREIFSGQEPAPANGPRTAQVMRRQTFAADGTDRREVTLRVPADWEYFRGHFDGHPILAGVVVLNNLVLAESRRAWPELANLRELAHLKFRRPIRPGEALDLRLVRQQGQPSVAFELRSQGERCNSGTLIFGVGR